MQQISITLSLTKFLVLTSAALLVSCNSGEPEWSDSELSLIESISLIRLPAIPASPSNRVADNLQAAELGESIFFDAHFSQNKNISCATCHQPERAFTDGRALGVGANQVGRNTQGLIGAPHQSWFYWDGRKDSLWAQALVPFEAVEEMGTSRLHVTRVIGQNPSYKNQYETVFGRFPNAVLSETLPADAGPWGDLNTRDNWHRIPLHLQHQINTVFANIGKAVAAYERTIAIPETRFDQFSEALTNGGERKANKILNVSERAGLKLFINQEKTHCLRCHNGPLLTNHDFHNIGTGNFDGPNLDLGRFLGVQAVLQDEFNCLGDFSDAAPQQCNAIRFLPSQIHSKSQGAFKTPGLRYLNKTAPYFHDGRHSTLRDVLNHYTNTPAFDSESPALSLTEQEVNQLESFLATLNDDN